jgi:hypothetical protein
MFHMFFVMHFTELSNAPHLSTRKNGSKWGDNSLPEIQSAASAEELDHKRRSALNRSQIQLLQGPRVGSNGQQLQSNAMASLCQR